MTAKCALPCGRPCKEFLPAGWSSQEWFERLPNNMVVSMVTTGEHTQARCDASVTGRPFAGPPPPGGTPGRPPHAGCTAGTAGGHRGSAACPWPR